MKAFDEHIVIPQGELQRHEMLGRGGFGEVYRGTWLRERASPVVVAIKILPTEHTKDSDLTDFTNEALMHKKLSHSNIVQMFGVTTTYPLSMVMEYMPNGSLRDFLKSTPRTTLTWNRRIVLGQNIASGIVYLHTLIQPVIHGDLKSPNICLDKNFVAKITDFGLSKIRLATATQTSLHTQSNGIAGSFCWMAPELFMPGSKNTFATDIYAYGWILSELAKHQEPYETDRVKGDDMIIDFILDGKRTTLPPGTPTDFQLLVMDCWDGNSKKRPAATEALRRLGLVTIPAVQPKEPPYILETRTQVPATVSVKTVANNSERLSRPMPPPPAATTSHATIITKLEASLAQPVSKKPHTNKQTYNEVLGESKYKEGETHFYNNVFAPALICYKQAAELNYVPAYLRIAQLYRHTFKNPVAAAEWAIKVAQNLEWCKDQAALGNPIALVSLGHACFYGDVVPKDDQLAVKYYAAAAKQGYADGQYALAVSYCEGCGIERDSKEAFALFQKSADQGSLIALYYLGFCYGDTKSQSGVPYNPNQALLCHQKAAELGQTNSLNYLGDVYTNGYLGQKADLPKAFKYYKRSAELGNTVGKYKLATCYEKGSGIKANNKKALTFYQEAAACGHESAPKDVVRMKLKIAPRANPGNVEPVGWKLN
ncbi:MAG: Sel1-like repeat-containing protein kinase family protein [Pseudomonadota bacterium]|nr:Sel1-like repeat-containing protein kinase family protein [Pseudomonadota bacterium]